MYVSRMLPLRPPASADPSSDPTSSETGPSSNASRSAPSTRSTLALVTAITGLVSAIAAFSHVPEEKTAKESYVVLQHAFIDQQAEVEDIKKEVVALRKSLEAYARAKEGDMNVIPKDSPPENIPPVEIHVRPSPSAVASTATSPASISSSGVSRVVTISATKPGATPRPLPDIRDIEAKAHAKQ